MKKNVFMTIALIALITGVLSAQTYDSESDFQVTKNGNAITITKYVGNKTAVSIPPSIQNLPVGGIKEGAFSDCTSLTSVTIPNTVAFIGPYAFFRCTSLTSVTIPGSVGYIGVGAFSGCTKLTAINVTADNTEFTSENGVLYNKAKTNLIKYPARKTATSFTIPNSVSWIVESAFSDCTGLTSVTIPNSVEWIGLIAFAGCSSLTSVTIPNTVTFIGEGAFYRCTSLTSVTFGGTIPSGGFNSAFDGDLRAKFYTTDKAKGTPGTYTRPNGTSTTWTKQSGSAGKVLQQPQTTAQSRNKLIVWSFTDELANMTKYYKQSHPEMEIEYSQTSSAQFQAKIDPVLVTGQGAPDIIALESAFVRKYVESGLLLDITDIYEANKNKLLAYPVEVGTYNGNGKVYAMSWQACPGAMFYRRSLAKKYLGTDDPKVVQTYFSDFNKFLDTAKLLKEKSGGKCVVISSLLDLKYTFLSARKDPWIVNGKLVIDPAIEQYLDICKTLHDNRWEGRVGQWSEGWFAGMKGELKDEQGRGVEVFSYFLPTWGLHYVLKTNVPGTAGDWAMVQGPSAYRWGGTWVGAYKGTKNAAAVKEFIRYVTADDSFLEAWAKETGDIVSNINVINKIKNNYREPFLGGQNHYAEFAEIAKGVNGKFVQGSDEAIGELLDKAVFAFVNGEKSKSQALSDFRNQANNLLW